MVGNFGVIAIWKIDERGLTQVETAVRKPKKTEEELQEQATSQELFKVNRKWGYLIIKRAFDFVCSLFALIVLSPILLIVAVLVKAEDGGPVIHKRRCIGNHYQTYHMYKYRTMVPDADNLSKYLTKEQIIQYKKEIKLDHDPRITRIGQILRKTSLDELPQLVNIIKGEMSLVGPRPLTKFELDYFGHNVESILSVKPGLTGYWQVHGRSDSTYESGMRQKLELYYVRNCSLGLDIKILFQTVFVVLRGVGAK